MSIVTRRQLKDILRPYYRLGRRVARRELHVGDLGYVRRLSFSQFGEDLWLAERFADQDEGLYVDVGAYDPFDASNTLLLYRRGWSGINVEPDPEALERLRRFRPRDQNVGFAVAARDGTATLSLEGSGSRLREVVPEGLSAVRVPTITLAHLLERLAPGRQIDLLDVDCEGRDLEVLGSNDWATFRPVVVLAESHRQPPTALYSFMEDVGYRFVRRFEVTHAFERVVAER